MEQVDEMQTEEGKDRTEKYLNRENTIHIKRERGGGNRMYHVKNYKTKGKCCMGRERKWRGEEV